MTRVNILLLCALILCALSLVTSRHHARRLTVELEREQARARQFDVEYGQLSLEQPLQYVRYSSRDDRRNVMRPHHPFYREKSNIEDVGVPVDQQCRH